MNPRDSAMPFDYGDFYRKICGHSDESDRSDETLKEVLSVFVQFLKRKGLYKRTPPLTDRQKEVWDALNGRALTGKELARELEASEDSIRQFVVGIRGTKRSVPNRAGRGYFRPDAPPAT